MVIMLLCWFWFILLVGCNGVSLVMNWWWFICFGLMNCLRGVVLKVRVFIGWLVGVVGGFGDGE